VEQDHVAADRSPHSRGVRLRDERIRDAVEAGDEFGFTTFAADVVGERHTDLVVAAPAEDVDSATDAGAVSSFDVEPESFTRRAHVSERDDRHVK
jgi:hypothetical protein